MASRDTCLTISSGRDSGCVYRDSDSAFYVACARTNCIEPGYQKCGQCDSARYCSRVCQKADWSEHKRTCALGGNPNTQRYRNITDEKLAAVMDARRPRAIISDEGLAKASQDPRNEKKP